MLNTIIDYIEGKANDFYHIHFTLTSLCHYPSSINTYIIDELPLFLVSVDNPSYLMAMPFIIVL